jgi:hypothetical protein
MAELEKVIKGLEEAKEYFRECRNNASLGSKAENHFWELQNAMNEAADLLKAQDAGWISVKDRLPEGKINPLTLDFNEVICFCNFGGDPKRTDVRTYKFGTRIGDTRPHFWHGPQIMDGVVTHWQYLPEPPEEET